MSFESTLSDSWWNVTKCRIYGRPEDATRRGLILQFAREALGDAGAATPENAARVRDAIDKQELLTLGTKDKSGYVQALGTIRDEVAAITGQDDLEIPEHFITRGPIFVTERELDVAFGPH